LKDQALAIAAEHDLTMEGCCGLNRLRVSEDMLASLVDAAGGDALDEARAGMVRDVDGHASILRP
jgi:hypothetical protein